ILISVSLPIFQPLPLIRRPEPFSHPDWIFGLKLDGFRSLAYVDKTTRLVSRNDNEFSGFTGLAGHISEILKGQRAVLDGEIVCLDDAGCSRFDDLLFHRGEPRFAAFDVLWLNGQDL